jgi:hypothetical protein
MREKLIELLEEAWWNYRHGKGPAGMPINFAEHLIANGVTVLPCNVGDKIYYIDRFTHKVEVDTVKFLTITKNGVKPILTRHNIKFWDFYELGKTVFFTKEEAKAYLPEPPKGE